MALFDPDTGKLIDPDGLRSVQFNGQGMTVPRTIVDRSADVKHVERIDDETGRSTGHDTLHGSGRVDCTVTPQPISVGAESQGV